MMEKITKDVGDIQSRLLDHRPVVQGEIRYFVREFEEKRGFRESRLLENLNRMVAETQEQALPTCTQALQEDLRQVLARLEAANHMTQRIQQRELEAQQSLATPWLLLLRSRSCGRGKWEEVPRRCLPAWSLSPA
nr:PREDICTED: biogenesis of lysosome-related organelles complex 1 subunit 5 isoform X2 [Lepisosteus oculatus]